MVRCITSGKEGKVARITGGRECGRKERKETHKGKRKGDVEGGK